MNVPAEAEGHRRTGFPTDLHSWAAWGSAMIGNPPPISPSGEHPHELPEVEVVCLLVDSRSTKLTAKVLPPAVEASLHGGHHHFSPKTMRLLE